MSHLERNGVVQSSESDNRLNEIQPAPITDLRDVPLEQLRGDVDVQRMANRVTGVLKEPSRIPIATFNSAI